MRVFTVMCLISIMPLASALATDSEYHYVRYGDAAQPPGGTMEYYDGGGYARNLLPMNLISNRSNDRLNYSAPQDNSTPQCCAPSASVSEDPILHPRLATPNVQAVGGNGLQP